MAVRFPIAWTTTNTQRNTAVREMTAFCPVGGGTGAIAISTAHTPSSCESQQARSHAATPCVAGKGALCRSKTPSEMSGLAIFLCAGHARVQSNTCAQRSR